jgi:hypothetical protein
MPKINRPIINRAPDILNHHVCHQGGMIANEKSISFGG